MERRVRLMGSRSVGIGVAGFGHWGPRLTRALHDCQGASVVALADLDPARRARAQAEHPGIPVVPSALHLLELPGVEAVALATPLATHYPLARAALEAGRHVLVEKPLAARGHQAASLVERAKAAGSILMVDYPCLHSPGLQQLRARVTSGELGRLLRVEATRDNQGRVQEDVDVLWDLAVHDLSMIHHLLGGIRPRAAAATGSSFATGGRIDQATLRLDFDGGLDAVVRVSWVATVPERRVRVVGTRGTAVHDELAAPASNPLRVSCQAFVDAVRSGRAPLACGVAGLRDVLVLEAAAASLGSGGAAREIDWGPLDRLASRPPPALSGAG